MADKKWKRNFVYLGRSYDGNSLSHAYLPLEAYLKAVEKEDAPIRMKTSKETWSFRKPVGVLLSGGKKPRWDSSDLVGGIYEIKGVERDDGGVSARACRWTGDTVRGSDDDHKLGEGDLRCLAEDLPDGEKVYAPSITLKILDRDAVHAFELFRDMKKLKKHDDILNLLAPIRSAMAIMSTRGKNEMILKVLNYLNY
jgi:hypothetical protein|tara:strand:- start:49 stop:639 length:591 start_codon:yes stop_codon:yes gene_type:complete